MTEDAGCSLELALTYESCPVCRRCVAQQQLLCPACVHSGHPLLSASGTQPQDWFWERLDQLADEKHRLQLRVEAANAARGQVPAELLEAQLCQQHLRVAQQRRRLQQLRDTRSQAQRASAASKAASSAAERHCALYNNKLAVLQNELYRVKEKLAQQLKDERRRADLLANRKRLLCHEIVHGVYQLQESDRSLIDGRLRLPALSPTRPASLDPSAGIYMAVLSTSSLIQAVGRCLAEWTPFQPMLLNFLNSPLSRDSITAQHQRMEAALHSLCQLYSVAFAKGDPVLTLARLVASDRIGRLRRHHGNPADWREAKNQAISYDPHHVLPEWAVVHSAALQAASSSSAVAAVAAALAVASASAAAASSDCETGEDWVEIAPDYPIPPDHSCYQASQFLSSLSSFWRA